MQSLVKSKLSLQVQEQVISQSEAENRIGETNLVRPSGKVIWLHAPDLRTANDFSELITQLRGANADISFILTTEKSEPQIGAVLAQEGVFHQFAVEDNYRFARKFLAHWAPDAGVWLSDSIYPLCLSAVESCAVPCIYVNATVSRKRRNKYLWFPNFIGAYLARFDRILASSDSSAIRLRRLRAPRKRLEVLGGFRAGATALGCNEADRTRLASHLASRPVWFAAHVDRKELAKLGKTQQRVSRGAQNLLMLLHLSHGIPAESAKRRLEALSLNVCLQSECPYPRLEHDVFIADVEQGLGVLYRVAPVSFIGGSMVPEGGNDPFEAAALGSAILHGPHFSNFQNSYDRLLDAGAARQVENSESLSVALLDLISPDRAALMAHAAWEVSTAGAEANDRVFELITTYLEQKDPANAPA